MSTVPFGRAVAIADAITSRLRALSGIKHIDIAGPLRRGEDMVERVEVVVAAADPSIVDEVSKELGPPKATIERASSTVNLTIDRLPVTVHCPDQGSAGARLLHLTGNAAHLGQLRAMA